MVQIQETPKILFDIISAIYLCWNIVFHTEMKHISMDYYFIHRQIQLDTLNISHISMKCELNCILTKP